MPRLPNAAEMRKLNQQALKEAADWAVERIRMRTQSGHDIEGNAFKPYSPAYRDLKAGSGRRTNPPDLTASGELLKLLRTLRVEPGRAVIGWKRQPHRAFKFERHGKVRAVLDAGQGLIRRRDLIGPVKQNLSDKQRRKIGLKALTITSTKLKLQRDGEESPIEDVVKGLEAKRPFFGLGKQDRAELRTFFETTLRKLVAEFVRTH